MQDAVMVQPANSTLPDEENQTNLPTPTTHSIFAEQSNIISNSL